MQIKPPSDESIHRWIKFIVVLALLILTVIELAGWISHCWAKSGLWS
jgi:hypothetical protein